MGLMHPLYNGPSSDILTTSHAHEGGTLLVGMVVGTGRFLPDTLLLRIRRKLWRRDFFRDLTRDSGPSMARESFGCRVHLQREEEGAGRGREEAKNRRKGLLHGTLYIVVYITIITFEGPGTVTLKPNCTLKLKSTTPCVRLRVGGLGSHRWAGGRVSAHLASTALRRW